jgi:hypothetical protein
METKDIQKWNQNILKLLVLFVLIENKTQFARHQI